MTGLIPWKRNDRNHNGNDISKITPASNMRMDWDQLFDRLLDDVRPTPTNPPCGIVLDASESDDLVRVRAEVPGINPEDLDISLAGEILTISGEKLDESESHDGGRYYSERKFGAFKRTVKLPCAVDADKVEAEHRNGVITITLRKSDAVRPKRIKVKSS